MPIWAMDVQNNRIPLGGLLGPPFSFYVNIGVGVVLGLEIVYNNGVASKEPPQNLKIII